MRRLKVIAIAAALASLTPFSAYAAYIAERGTTIVPGMAKESCLPPRETRTAKRLPYRRPLARASPT